MRTKSRRRDRPSTNVEVIANAERSAGDTLNFLGAELRNDDAPLADSSRTDAQRPRDIRGVLKVIDNVLFEHKPSVTAVQMRMQPQSKTVVLTSVHMEKLVTLAERLVDAMGQEVSASDLARACNVSPAAVSKWLDGRTKALKADTLASAARALGVREEWLRTGKLPRDRQDAEEDRQVDRVITILEELRDPLAALAAAIDQLSSARPATARKRQRA